MQKHEWKKSEKDIYLPPAKPVIQEIPTFKYFAVDGAGDPNGEEFQSYVEALYALSYGVRMSYKKGIEPEGFFEYTVYPLEGVWDVSDDVKKNPDKAWDKSDLVFCLMIRQPEFVTDEFFEKIREITMKKKPNESLKDVKLVSVAEGMCCQMTHMGSYDDERASFDLMEEYCGKQGYLRAEKIHREIYITDPRKTASEKFKTVLRFKVKKSG